MYRFALISGKECLSSRFISRYALLLDIVPSRRIFDVTACRREIRVLVE
jgi:hypothetical protein